MLNIGLEVVTASCVFISAVVFHELGHWRYLKNRYEGATIEFSGGYFRTYIKAKYVELKVGGLKKEERNETLWAGILAGMIPIVCYSLVTDWWVLPTGVAVVYAVGCINDVQLMVKE